MNYKKLKAKNKDLQFRLDLANEIINKQTEAFDSMCKHFESQLNIQDKELERRLILIHYLEDKVLKY